MHAYMRAHVCDDQSVCGLPFCVFVYEQVSAMPGYVCVYIYVLL